MATSEVMAFQHVFHAHMSWSKTRRRVMGPCGLASAAQFAGGSQRPVVALSADFGKMVWRKAEQRAGSDLFRAAGENDSRIVVVSTRCCSVWYPQAIAISGPHLSRSAHARPVFVVQNA
jgi:hypothetical protein